MCHPKNPEIKIPEKRAVLHESPAATVGARTSLTLYLAFFFFPLAPLVCVFQTTVLFSVYVCACYHLKKTPNHINCNKQRHFEFHPLDLLAHVKIMSWVQVG